MEMGGGSSRSEAVMLLLHFDLLGSEGMAAICGVH